METLMDDHFYHSSSGQPHPNRRREILKRHPEIRGLMGKNPATFFILIAVLGVQAGLAYWLGRLGTGSGLWMTVLVICLFAYSVGAFANHCLDVIIHEACHGLIFKDRRLNRMAAMMADLPNLIPASMGFFVYHMKHHAHQGDYDLDADLASRWEAAWVGDSSFRKGLWLFLFPFFQLTRPFRLRRIRLWSIWFWINCAIAVAFDVLVLYFCGPFGLLYLVLSFLFSVGLHPVGARWIQEHYTIDGAQETFSYYGPLNLIALNVGYHNEHHDFPAVPWNRLPEIRAIAPEYYDNLKSHDSWIRLLLSFVFDQRYTLYSRVTRLDAAVDNRRVET
jgi:sphingolipid 4-desaturase/C4-monooxygenase